MAQNFDELIEHLLREIALCGEQGASSEEFLTFITNFYELSKQPEADCEAESNEASRPVPTVDRRLCEQVWKWLIVHPDVLVGKENEGRKLTLTGFEARARATRTTDQGNEPQPIPVLPGDVVNGPSALSSEQHDAQPTDTNGRAKNTEGPRSSHGPSPLRLYVTTERIWQALTGHGPDTKRVPELEFNLLSVIASSGREGILQAELVKASGQDKRSVPKRTDNLHDKGYIEKRGVLTKGARTSICILKKYAKETGVPGTGKTVDALSNVVFQHGRLVYDNFLDFITRLLKDRKIITFEDLRDILGISGKRWESKAMFRSIARLEKLGIVLRVMAKQSNVESAYYRKKRYPCVKILREPNDKDRQYLRSLPAKEDLALHHDSMLPVESNDDAPGDIDIDMLNDEQEEENHAAEPATTETADEESRRNAPQWTPDHPLGNFLFNLIDSKGMKGMSSMEIRDLSAGPFWRRPMEIVLGRLTDVWQTSQPLHLRHLAIVRDTSLTDKQLHYLYRTYDNFGKAVEAGEAVWEAILTAKKPLPKAKSRGKGRSEVEVDEWGFPALSATAFFGGKGTSTLQEMYAKNKSIIDDVAWNKVIKNLGDETDTIIRGIITNSSRVATSKPSGRLRKPTTGQNPPDDTEAGADAEVATPKPSKPMGRPRKYAAGQEPYMKRRRERQEETLAAETAAFAARIRMQAVRIAQEEATLQRSNVVLGSSALTEGTSFPDSRPIEASQNVEQLRNAQTPVIVGEGRGDAITLVVDENLTPVQSTTSGSKRKKTKTASAGRARKAVATTDALPAGVFNERVQELIVELTNMSRPGVYFNPPGYQREEIRKGRPPKALVAIFKLSRLKELDLPPPGTFRDLDTMLAPQYQDESALVAPVAQAGTEYQSVSAALSALNLPYGPAVPPPIDETCHHVNQPSTHEVPTDAQTQAHAVNTHAMPTPSADVDTSDFQPPKRKTRRLPRKPEAASQSSQLEHPIPSSSLLAAQPQVPSTSVGQTIAVETAQTESESPLVPVLGIMEACPLGRRSTPTYRSPYAPASSAEGHSNDAIDVDGPRVPPNRLLQSSNPAEIQAEAQTEQVAPQFAADASIHNLSSAEVEDGLGRSSPAVKSTPVTSSAERRAPARLLSSASKQKPRKSIYKPKMGVRLGEGHLGFKKRKILMEMIDKCGGAYPGNQELLQPFVALWKEQYSDSPPDRYTILRTVKALVDNGTLLRLGFTVTDFDGVVEARQILMKPGVSSSSDLVTNMQSKIIEQSPRLYHPPEVAHLVTESTQRPHGTNFRPDDTILVDRIYQPPHLLRLEKKVAEAKEKREAARLILEASKQKEAVELQRPGRLLTLFPRLRKPPVQLPKPGVTLPTPRTILPTPGLMFEPPELPKPLSTPYVSGSVTSYLVEGPSQEQERQEDHSALPIPVPPNPPPQTSTTEGNFRNAQHRLRQLVPEPPTVLRASRRLFDRQPPPNLNNSLRSLQQGPDISADSWNCQAISTLMDPDQPFHAASGTFGTQYHVLRIARPPFWISQTGGLQAQEMLEKLVPESLEDLRKSFRLPGATRNHDRRDNPDYSRFEETVDYVSRWENSLVKKSPWRLSGFTVKEPHFINHTLTTKHRTASTEFRDLLVQWSGASGQLHSLRAPPPAVSDDEDDDGVEKPPRKRRARGRPSQLSLNASRALAVAEPTGKPKRVTWVKPNSATSRKRKRALDGEATDGAVSEASAKRLKPAKPNSGSALGVLPARLNKKLILAVIAVRTLTGGLDQNIDWSLVMAALPGKPSNRFKRLSNPWSFFKQNHRNEIDKMQENFEERFLEAVESGELPLVDSDDPESYDWLRLVEWADKTIETPSFDDLELPADRDTLEAEFVIQERPAPKVVRINMHTTKERERAVMETSYQAYIPPLSPAKSSVVAAEATPTELELAKSWVIATVATPEAQYNEKAAQAELVRLDRGTNILQTAITALVDEKVILRGNKGRVVPGRNYALTGRFHQAFESLTTPRIVTFHQARNFKFHLDNAFSNPASEKRRIDVRYDASDGEIMALTNLLTGGRVKLIPRLPPIDHAHNPKEPTISKWGWLEGNYKSMHMDREKLFFGLEIVPTAEYIFGNPLATASTTNSRTGAVEPAVPLPPSVHLHDGRPSIPLWFGIHGNVNWEWWNKLLRVVLNSVAFRPGTSTQMLVNRFKGLVPHKDMVRCVQWCLDAGVLKRMGNDTEALTTGEWWWMAIVVDCGEIDGKVGGTKQGRANTVPDVMDVDDEDSEEESGVE
ncbi:hypothetical protein H2201_006805 [Coniosporium apollinis]|uniref:B-block binding subunit of TFIIIC domain-containing protein n=1 Tax=Coniosporium apollinis TaxID=61459 RepID=A0ABQ9NN64_9PEZI|nr:hypothetical protein H2201_006805 [Coniosporium apollinis]